VFWVFIALGIVGLFIWSYFDQKAKGYLDSVTGFIHRVQHVDSSKLSIVFLYPDRITIDDVQIIPLNRVERAYIEDNTHRVSAGRGYSVKREYYSLNVIFTNKEGRQERLECESGKNPIDHGSGYEIMVKKINELIGYVEPKNKKPTKPYEL
jgi:hypothetical protein